MSDYSQTNYTLLGRAINLDDQEAWNELYDVYGNFIHNVLSATQVDTAQIENLSQDVFVKLTDKLKSFDKEKGKFRPWLKAVIRNTAISYIRKQSSHKRKLDALNDELVIHGENKTLNDIDNFIDEEWRKHLYNIALRRVEKHFRGRAIEVYKLRMEGHNSHEVVEITGLKLYSVQTLFNRVRKAMLEEGKALIRDYETL